MKKISVFKKNKIIELIFFQGVFSALVLGVGSVGELNFFLMLLPCMLIAAIMQLGFYVFHGKNYLTEIHSQQEVFFDGDIEALTRVLYSSGLKLRSHVGKFYIFTPNYSLFPKEDILVFENRSGCLLQAKHIVIKYLSELIRFGNLPCYRKIENKNTDDNRKQDRYSSDSKMIANINNNKKRR